MSIFDDEITDTSLEDLGFVPIGKNKWLYLFTSSCVLTGRGDLKFAYDELIYYSKKKILKAKSSKQKFEVADLYELKLTVDSLSKNKLEIDESSFNNILRI